MARHVGAAAEPKGPIMQTVTPDTLTDELAQFHGSEQLYLHWLGGRFTEGVKHLADRAGAYWLIDAIFSHQRGRVRLEPFQVWRLDRLPEGGAKLHAWTDTPNASRWLKTQTIEYTDFPLDQIDLWLVDGVLMLPTEY